MTTHLSQEKRFLHAHFFQFLPIVSFCTKNDNTFVTRKTFPICKHWIVTRKTFPICTLFQCFSIVLFFTKMTTHMSQDECFLHAYSFSVFHNALECQHITLPVFSIMHQNVNTFVTGQTFPTCTLFQCLSIISFFAKMITHWSQEKYFLHAQSFCVFPFYHSATKMTTHLSQEKRFLHAYFFSVFSLYHSSLRWQHICHSKNVPTCTLFQCLSIVSFCTKMTTHLSQEKRFLHAHSFRVYLL